jgi:tRNA pseudouridine55 synthase
VIIDKPQGITSHDVVSRVRKALNVRRVGHAGTLDPMATGVLVVMVGEATKLAPYLSSNDKSYRARVQLGVGTDTLDAEGDVVARAALPAWYADVGRRREQLAGALEIERRRHEQIPPSYSAIKIEGKAAHRRVRAGEQLALPARPIAVRGLELCDDDDAGSVVLSMVVSKGYYVRSLARDLGQSLGVPAHLTELRRTASGVFDIAQSVPLDPAGPLTLVPLAEAARRALPAAVLTPEGCERAGHGGLVRPQDFVAPPAGEGPCAWLDGDARLVAVGALRDEKYVVLRGFPEVEG